MSPAARPHRRTRSAFRRLGLESLENRSLLAIDLISAALPGPYANGPSGSQTPPSVSFDGRFVGFVSSATNLVVGDTNRLQDVFVRDTTGNVAELISRNALGVAGNGASDEISITPDGRYAVFSSLATNLTAEASDGVFVRDRNTNTLVFIARGYAPAISADGRFVTFMGEDGTIAGDNNGSDDAFLWDRVTDTITKMSVRADGTQTPAFTITGNPTISADGAFVAFNSNAGNLVANDLNGAQDVFLKNVATGALARVSLSATGFEGNGDSILPSLSANGQIIAFRSVASNFVANDTGSPDIFVKFLPSEALVRATLTSQGNPSNATFFSEPVISGDGRFVAFESDASNLVANDTNGVNDAFVRDLQFNTVTRTSVDVANVQGDFRSFNPTTSSGGRYAAFYSFATNLIGDVDGKGFSDVFWKDLQTGEVRLVSANFDPPRGFSGNNNAFGPGAMTADGRFIAFTSAATDLVANDANGSESDIFIRDTVTGTTTLVSRDSNGVQGNFDSYWPSLSGDGRWLTFTSEANNLVGGDSNNRADIFRKDLTTGAVVKVTVTGLGLQSNNDSDQSMVSDDGRYVVFFSFANNLVSGDSNNLGDVFRKDFQTGVIERVSVDGSGFQANGESDVPTLSADGRFVAFQSYASNLIANDTNGFADVFVKDMQFGTVTRASVTAAGVQGNGDSLAPRITSGGGFVAFQSVANNLVTGDTNGVSDVFLKNLSTGAIVRASVNASVVQGNGASTAASASSDGRYVAFLSAATNLVTGDSNGFVDVFRKDLTTGAVVRMNVSDTGAQADGSSDRPLISRDGSLVTFASLAENLTSYDGNGFRDVFRAGLNVAGGLSLTLSANTVNESVASVTGTVTRTGSVTSSLVVNLSSSNTNVATVPATVTIPANQTQATFTVTILGPPSTVITATAAGLGTATQTLTVTGVNNAPSFSLIGDPPAVPMNAGTQTVNNFAFNISPGPPDEAGQTVTFSVGVSSTTGNLSFAVQPTIDATTGTLTYAASAGTSGTAQVSVILFDNGGTANGGDNTSAPQTFTIRVNAGNPAAPTVNGIPGNQVLRVNENTGFLTFTVGDDATPPGSLVVTATSSLPGLIPNANIQLGGAGANRTIFITPVANQTGGPATIAVSVRDADLNVTTFQFNVTVIPFVVGDILPDGVVDVQDVAFMVYYFATYGPGPMNRLPPGPPQRADVNLDGLLDSQDVLIVIDLWRRTMGGEGEAEAVAADAPTAENEDPRDLALLQLFAPETQRKKK